MRKVVLSILLICVCFVFGACGKETVDEQEVKKEPELTVEEQNIAAAKEAVTNMFTNFQSLNFKEAGKYVDVDGIEMFIGSELGYMGGDQFMNEWFDTLSCEIVSAEAVDKKSVSIYAKITARDMTELLLKKDQMLSDYIAQNASTLQNYTQDQIMGVIETKSNELFRECVQSEEYGTVTSSITLNVTKTDGKWNVDVDNDFLNAILGDFVGAMEAMGFTVEQ